MRFPPAVRQKKTRSEEVYETNLLTRFETWTIIISKSR